ncbi:MAG TPA: histidine kinase dimerization/phosphoacceptor domain-containing protein, partial [Actinomycetota bacterium]
MKQRTAFRLAWSVWALSMVALLLPFAYRLTGHHVNGFGDQPGSAAPAAAVLVFILTFATVGAVVAAKRPSNPIGWLLLASGMADALGTFSILVGQYSTRWSDWLSSWVWGLGIAIPAAFVLLLFPSGTLPSKRWRIVAWLAGVVLVGSTLGNALAPGLMSGSHSVNPLGIGGPAGPVLKAMRNAFGLILPAGLACLASLIFRFRRADSVEREQLKWLVYAGVLLVAGFVAGAIVVAALGTNDLSNNIQNAIVAGSFVFVPLAIGTAVLKYRLYDIDVVINKTVVYGLLAAFITAVYVAIVVGIGALIGQGTSRPNLGLSILATAVVAVAFQPVRDRIQRLANRLVYGRRATPYEVLSEFSQRMGASLATEDVLPRMARILAEGTGAAEARVWLKVGDELRDAAGWPSQVALGHSMALPGDGDGAPAFSGATDTFAVHHRGELLGALSLTKAPGDRLKPAEEHLARDLAAGAGLVLRNVGLTQELLVRLDQLQASRRRIVAAADEARRKLERDIHDGAQQQLVALAVRTRLAGNLLAGDPGKGDELLATIEAGLGDALQDLGDLA